MAKKHILFITSRADIGGGSQHLFLLLKGLKELHPNIKASIASPNDEPFFPIFRELASESIEIPHRSFNLLSWLKLLIFARNNNIDLIHSHGRGAGIYSRLLSLFGFFVVHTFHGVHKEQSLTGRIKYHIDQFLASLTDKFICVSEDEREKAILNHFAEPQKIEVINNGIDLGTFRNFKETRKESFREELQLNEGKVWGTLCRISDEKGIDLFFNCITQSPSLSHVQFLIAGGGEQLERYRERIRREKITNIHLLGETREVQKFLNSIDGFFSFSRTEGLPLSVLEALASSKPCILSNIKGHQIFKNHATLFDLSDVEDFSFKFKESIFKEETHNWLDQNFSHQRMIQKTVEQYY